MNKGKFITLARGRMMWRREQIAQKLNLDFHYLAQLENGVRKIGASYLQRAKELTR